MEKGDYNIQLYSHPLHGHYSQSSQSRHLILILNLNLNTQPSPAIIRPRPRPRSFIVLIVFVLVLFVFVFIAFVIVMLSMTRVPGVTAINHDELRLIGISASASIAMCGPTWDEPGPGRVASSSYPVPWWLCLIFCH